MFVRAQQIAYVLTLVSLIERGGNRWGVHFDQFSIEGGDNRRLGVHVSQFSIEMVPNRRGPCL